MACPKCRNSEIKLEKADFEGHDIIEGLLTCPQCGNTYKIANGIPNMIADMPENGVSGSGNSNKHYEIREANIDYYENIGDVFDIDKIHSVCLNDFNQQRIEGVVKDIACKTGAEWFLDIGCGTGNVLKFGTKHFKHAVGVDISPKLLQQARAKGLDVVRGDITVLPFRQGVFDAVSSFSVVHHIYDYSFLIMELGRAVKKNGFLYTDWDPQKISHANSILFNMVRVVFFVLVKIGIYNGLAKSIHSDPDIKIDDQAIDYMKLHPELKEIYKKAEYHEQIRDRGLDREILIKALAEAGFDKVDITGHWQGKKYIDLHLSRMNRIELWLRSKSIQKPVDALMENIMIVAHHE